MLQLGKSEEKEFNDSIFTGKLNVPEDAKFSKRQKDLSKFSDELQNISLQQYIESNIFHFEDEYVKKYVIKKDNEEINFKDAIHSCITKILELREEENNIIKEQKDMKKIKEIEGNIIIKGRKIRDVYLTEDITNAIYKKFSNLKNKDGTNLNFQEIKGILARVCFQSGGILFSHEPSVDDIKQSKLGDCYLLSSLMSLIKSSKEYGPEFIMNMMKDNMDGTVTVRLHKIKFDEQGNFKSAEPRYYIVNKAFLPQNALSELWVNLIEKAYAIGGFNNLKYKQNKSTEEYKEKKNQVRNIQDLKGGSSQYALMVLTGKETSAWRTNKDKNSSSLSEIPNKFNLIKKCVEQSIPTNCAFKATNEDDKVQKSDKDKESKITLSSGVEIFLNHAYSIIGTNGKDSSISLINPHADGVFHKVNDKRKKSIEVPKADFEKYLKNIIFLEKYENIKQLLN